MTTVPEEAVKAAKEVLYYANPNDVERALTAALPHLPGVGVKADTLKLIERMAFGYEVMFEKLCHISGTSGADQSWYRSKAREAMERLSPLHSITTESNKSVTGDCKRQYQDFMSRILSALEPSAARELTLVSEEAVIALSSYMQADEDGVMVLVSRQAIEECLPTLRALSSPDHADAGKVEGDGSAAARDVLAERRRQIEAEGWTPEHDDQWRHGALAKAATCYASVHPLAASYWPWDLKWWKPSDRRRNLVKAGALILAEIERLDRAASRAPAPQLRPAKKRLPKVPEKRATHPSGGDRHGE